MPGEQLSCVIIDKSAVRRSERSSDGARIESIRDAGGNPFYDYQIPQAAILKQGFGRLIRASPTAACWSCSITGSRDSATARCFFDSLPA